MSGVGRRLAAHPRWKWTAEMYAIAGEGGDPRDFEAGELWRVDAVVGGAPCAEWWDCAHPIPDPVPALDRWPMVGVLLGLLVATGGRWTVEDMAGWWVTSDSVDAACSGEAPGESIALALLEAWGSE